MTRILVAILSLTFTILIAIDLSYAEPLAPRYKMFFMNTSSQGFNPEQDVLNPSKEELALEELHSQIMSAALQSFFPFMTTFVVSPNAKKLSIQDQLLVMVTNLQKAVATGVSSAVKDTSILPLTQSFMLVPNSNKKTDLFYGADKISIHPSEIVNVFTISPGHPKFDSKLSALLTSTETLSFFSTPGSKLIAARSDISIQSASQSQVKLQVLLDLNPLDTPFVESSDQVKFERLVVPQIDNKRPVALMTFLFDLSNQNSAPELIIELGQFDRFENGQFLLSADINAKALPKLMGHVNRTGFGFVSVEIAFSKLKFDLTKSKLTSINTITRPGFAIGSSNFVIGGFKIKSVDQQFETEINKKIDAEIKSAINKGSNSIESKIMSKEIMDLLLKKIMG